MRQSFLTILVAGLFLFNFNSHAQRLNGGQRVPDTIDEHQTVTLTGNHHPLARPEFDEGPASPDYPMTRMILTLRSAEDQQSALGALLEAQQDPGSPSYHQWLTPAQFEDQFGVSEPDARRVAQWLTSYGFTIDEIPAGRRAIVFSGTAAQVASAFHTEIHRYNVGGALHFANAADPQIPQALSSVVAGTVSLHDFRRHPMHARLQAAPQYTSGSAHYLAPADFAAIYDVAPLYSSAINGTGQTIAIVGRTNIQISDVQTFRSTFGLAANNPVVVVNGPNPGIISTDEEAEADLDVEWSGAVAPKATVKFVVSASTSSTDGVDLSAQYIVSSNLGSVMSTSFGSCESEMGSSERNFYNNVWEQAAAEGITALVAAGDSGAAGCDSPSETKATEGLAVNGLCSTPYSVCVGGTEFNEAGNTNLYWSATNNSTTLASALSYIPEVAWNESGLASGGSGLWATGGGASLYYTKPSWQTGTGVPADGKRDVPDVALSAAGHDGYLVDILGSFYIISGTSAASPSMAGLMALVNQKTAARQGNANTVFYGLATLAASGGAAVFHGTTGGNNSVPGLTGFTAGPHYNQATGLGSVDAFVMVNHWTDVHATPAFSVSTASSSASILQGGQASVTATVAVTGGFSAAVALSVSGLPSGVTASFAPASFAAPGSGTSTLTLTAASAAAGGSFTLTISATSGSVAKTTQVALTVVPVFTMTESASALTLGRGASGTVTLTTRGGTGFNSAVQLAVSGAPAGVTASFSPTQISAPGSGSSVLTVAVSSSATAGTYTLTISANGGGVTQQASVSLTVSIPGYTLSAMPSAFSLPLGG
ncbi:MAG TPA: protease pro-enzyme activation domain-containing protein, partial [Bryobacteraceae bacterium]|nr:protease pro-enzyme activation domain-containing protein [Bryobacteraceae bacterium]